MVVVTFWWYIHWARHGGGGVSPSSQDVGLGDRNATESSILYEIIMYVSRRGMVGQKKGLVDEC